ncbi:MAG: HAD family hydrolase [Lentisphaeria bacterium]|nr:HAD family hydrolase [Lentisphaeria bacterium]
MKFKALLFDINGTVTDILTSESDEELYRVTANFLKFNGVSVSPGELKALYFDLNRQQRHESPEEFPEFDVKKIFQTVIEEYGDHAHVPVNLAVQAATVFRAASQYRLEPYTGVTEVLTMMKKRYHLAAVSDGQSLWARPELRMAGLEKFFEFVIVSGDHGFRKPDKRMFTMALEKLHITPAETIYVGNDMYRDVYGAKNAGIKSIFFKSNQGEHGFCGAEPDYIIYNFNELPRAVEFLETHS